jgi:hypothetical protein
MSKMDREDQVAVKRRDAWIGEKEMDYRPGGRCGGVGKEEVGRKGGQC